jgi:hypothetical protein
MHPDWCSSDFSLCGPLLGVCSGQCCSLLKIPSCCGMVMRGEHASGQHVEIRACHTTSAQQQLSTHPSVLSCLAAPPHPSHISILHVFLRVLDHRERIACSLFGHNVAVSRSLATDLSHHAHAITRNPSRRSPLMQLANTRRRISKHTGKARLHRD